MALQEAVKVLVVEDELIVAADLENSLNELGFQVVATANDADQAVALAQTQRPELILMDIQLNGEPAGIRVADTVRRTWNIPVVFLTAYTTEDIMQRARAAGAYGFLSKPFRVEDLNATILIALQQHRLGQELFKENNWLVTMLASLSDGVIATDASGCVRYINPAAEALTQWTSAEAMGRPIEEVYPLRHIDGGRVPECQLRRALAARAPIPKERFLMHVKGDDELPVEDSAAPIIQDGHLLGAVTIFLDITSALFVEDQQRQEHGRLQTEARKTSLELGETKEELRALSGRLMTAQEDERRRLARELHDDVSQRMALLDMECESALQTLEPDPAQTRERLRHLREQVAEISTDVRTLSHRLHPSILEHLGVAPALESLLDEFTEREGMITSFNSDDGVTDLSLDTATGLYRITQEALRNVAKHAGKAHVNVSLYSADGHIVLEIADSGQGFNLEQHSPGLGLVSMKERARLIGATLTIESAPQRGTTVTVRTIAQPAN